MWHMVMVQAGMSRLSSGRSPMLAACHSRLSVGRLAPVPVWLLAGVCGWNEVLEVVGCKAFTTIDIRSNAVTWWSTVWRQTLLAVWQVVILAGLQHAAHLRLRQCKVESSAGLFSGSMQHADETHIWCQQDTSPVQVLVWISSQPTTQAACTQRQWMGSLALLPDLIFSTEMEP